MNREDVIKTLAIMVGDWSEASLHEFKGWQFTGNEFRHSTLPKITKQDWLKSLQE